MKLLRKVSEYILAIPALIIYLVVSIVMVTKLVVEKKINFDQAFETSKASEKRLEEWDNWKWDEIVFIIVFLIIIVVLLLLRGV